MKKNFTLRSMLAAIVLCCSTWSLARTLTESPSIDCGQTGVSYMPDVVYVGQSEFAEFWIRGKHLQGDVTFRGYSDKDTEAIFAFNPETVTKSEVETGTELESKIFRVYITPKAIIRDAKYFLEVVTPGYTANPIRIAFPRVVDTIPRFSFEVENPYGDTIYVGREYESKLFVKGYEYVKENVHLLIPEGSDIISITPNELTKEDVSATWGAEVTVRFKPSKATEGDRHVRTTFPLIVRTAGMEDLLCDEVACHVNPATPAVDITAGLYGKDTYVGKPFQKTIYVKGNPFLQGDITLSKVNEADDIVFEPSVIAKADAQRQNGAAVVVTITPKEASGGKMAYFYFKASTPGAEDTESHIRAWEVKDAIPEVSLQVPSYISENGMVGKNSKIAIQVIANEFTTSDIRLYSEDAHVRAFDPVVISADSAKVAGGAKVIVYIRPSEASESAYAKQSFVIKAHTDGAAADAEATIQFVVDANDGTGTDADPEITNGVDAVLATCRVWSASETLFFELHAGAKVEVYDITGQCVACLQATAGVNRLIVPNGMYVVRVNGMTAKVVAR